MLEPIPDQVLDIQHDPDPAQDHGPARRIPHLGHAFFFFSLAFMVYLLCAVAVLSIAHVAPEQIMQHLGLGLLIQVLAYIIALAAAAWIFPHLWSKPFLTGIEWNALAVTRRWFWIIPFGIIVSFAAQIADTHLPQPSKSPIDSFFHTPLNAWFITAFGALLAPLFEEIAFRGFLLPALATAYDWLALDRTPAGLQRWESSTDHTVSALAFASVFSSVAFVLMHGPELSFRWGLMAVLFVVSLIFSWVRLRFHSVAASVLMHATYNSTIFVIGIVVTHGYRHLEKLSS